MTKYKNEVAVLLTSPWKKNRYLDAGAFCSFAAPAYFFLKEMKWLLLLYINSLKFSIGRSLMNCDNLTFISPFLFTTNNQAKNCEFYSSEFGSTCVKRDNRISIYIP